MKSSARLCGIIANQVKGLHMGTWQRKPPIQRFFTLYHLYNSHSFHAQCRASKTDGRARLSLLWVPTGGIAVSTKEDVHTKLIRAGFLRQAHSGIFHLLPLGLRVQDKLERLIDRYMSGLGASKLSLSSISSQELWSQSGRLQKANAELFRFQDRRKVGYLLSPTHEEEITTLVARSVKSYRELPIRLYQISRKYRDERRPRHGLLRSREFVMKDLYTFDYSPSMALATYREVREAYARLFDELKLPYLVAEADSGDIGGDLSHEFHFPTSTGEDNVMSCDVCDYVANEELAVTPILEDLNGNDSVVGSIPQDTRVWRGISKDRGTLINVWYSTTSKFSSATNDELPVNLHAIKAVFPELDPSVENPLQLWEAAFHKTDSDEKAPAKPRLLLNLIDYRLPISVHESLKSNEPELPIWPDSLAGSMPDIETHNMNQDLLTGRPLNLLRIRDGDACPRCPDGILKVQKAIELGHTFHLGTRYSEPLSAKVAVPEAVLTGGGQQGKNVETESTSQPNQEVALQMGCHGIGVSRMIAAVADTLSDSKGLNWPRIIAPYEAIVIPGKHLEDEALEIYDHLSAKDANNKAQLDVVLDDRIDSFAWKMKDADLVGYPIIVVVGRRWTKDRMCEVQCRRLGIKEDVRFDELGGFVRVLLETL